MLYESLVHFFFIVRVLDDRGTIMVCLICSSFCEHLGFQFGATVSLCVDTQHLCLSSRKYMTFEWLDQRVGVC